MMKSGHHQIYGLLPAKSVITGRGGIKAPKAEYNWNTGYSGAEVGRYRSLNMSGFYTPVYSGYGESLIDYNF